MRKLSPNPSKPRFVLHTFVSIIAVVFVVDLANNILIDHDWTWHESILESISDAILCVPLLGFLAFLPLKRALDQQREKTAQLEAAHTELAFIHTAFKDAEAKYRGLFENSPIGIYQIDPNGALLTVNPAYAVLLGHPSRGEALQSDHASVYLLLDRHQELIQGARKNGKIIRHESQVRRRDGQVIWITESLCPSYDATGTLQFYDGTLQDITERMQTEERLREREARLSRTNSMLLAQQEATLDGILIVDENQHIASFNARFCELWDIPAELAAVRDDGALLGHVSGQLSDWSEFVAKVQYLYAHPQEGSEDEISLRDGRVFERNSVPVISEDGQSNGRVWYFRDITARKRAEEELSTSREMLRSIVENIPQSVFWKDLNSVYLGCNRNYANNCLRERPEDIIGKSVYDLMSTESAAGFIDSDQRVMETDTPEYHSVKRTQLLDGREMWTEINKVPLHDAAGKVVGILGTLEDITERKQSEEELRNTRNMLQMIIDNIPQSIFWKDTESAYLGCNETFAHVAGQERPEDMVGKTDYELPWKPDETEWFRMVDRRVMDTDTPEYRIIEPQLRADGTETWLETNKIPLHDGDGNVVGILGTFEDITERKRIEADLVLAKDQAEAASRAKSQFLANMSHELRTPMNAVIGFSEILQDQAFGPLNPHQAKYIGNILNSGRHLLKLINDILDITKIEAGRMTLDLAPVDVAETVEGVQNVIKALSMKKQIAFSVEVEDHMPKIQADSGCLKQILYNLFSNAIKFTPEGGQVRVCARYNDGALDVSVADSGIGISPKDQARIWGEFEQVDSTYARTQQGTGLGLALTRRLVELHGGRIWVESEGVGLGSHFQFSIPAAADAIPVKAPLPPLTALPAADPETPGADGRPWVLLVEDDPQAVELLTHCLEEAGYAVSRAGDGDQALFLAPFANPCAILLDIEIPIKDGWEVLSELKSDPRTQDIPVVIVSVNHDRARALSLGASECFAKPIDRASLIQTLRRVQARPSAELAAHIGNGISNV
jgi:PAS domain S-box-containing protein